MYIFMGFIFLVGLGMTIGFGYLVKKGISARSWPTVEGKILSSTLVAKEKAKGVQLYGSSLKFEYKVDGKHYQGKNADLLEWHNAKIIKLFKAEKYFAGRPVKVYYNPMKPAEAILEPGVKFKYVYPAFCGLLLCAALVYGFIYGRG
jgi:hypothetical protein